MSKRVDSNSSLFDYDWNNTANWNEDRKCIIPDSTLTRPMNR